MSTYCQCGREKRREAHAFCERCFARLPDDLRLPLARRPLAAPEDIERAQTWLERDLAAQEAKRAALRGARAD